MTTVKVNQIHQAKKLYTWDEIQVRPGVYRPNAMVPGTFLVVKDARPAFTDYQATTKFILVTDDGVSTNLCVVHSNWPNQRFEYVGNKIDLTIEVTNVN